MFVSNMIPSGQQELFEKKNSTLSRNRSFLVKKGIDHSIFIPTSTGLKKSILDATQPVRLHFKLADFHDYESQQQGNENKVISKAYFLSSTDKVVSRLSLYRPKTKKGDPRMWFRGLGEFALEDNHIAIVVFKKLPYLINLSTIDLEVDDNPNSPIGIFISNYIKSNSEVADELLAKLKKIAETPLPALGKGDTAVGMAIENALGISANSSKEPDYQGIELKSGRGSRNRSNLFAQVADWANSECKSSREILNKYGYSRGDDFKLYCTISTKKINSQGLFFKYFENEDVLCEVHESGADVAVWSGNLLRERLFEKHSETFWVQAESKVIEGVEHFILKSVIHTKSPLLNQLMPLIANGVITMDHLIKKTGGNKPKVSEKGPLFKIDKKNLSLLFPEPIKYSLK